MRPLPFVFDHKFTPLTCTVVECDQSLQERGRIVRPDNNFHHVTPGGHKKQWLRVRTQSGEIGTVCIIGDNALSVSVGDEIFLALTKPGAFGLVQKNLAYVKNLSNMHEVFPPLDTFTDKLRPTLVQHISNIVGLCAVMPVVWHIWAHNAGTPTFIIGSVIGGCSLFALTRLTMTYLMNAYHEQQLLLRCKSSLHQGL